ncbi:hypothetical protein ACSBR1_040722 [Camellia fascicularis]
MDVLELWVIFIFLLVFSSPVQVSNSQNPTCNSNDLKALESFLIGKEIDGQTQPSYFHWFGPTHNPKPLYQFPRSLVPVGICVSSTRIRIIVFPVNYFYGRIPSGFGNCSSLAHLWLGENFLAGDIPEDIFQLPRLNQLGLQDNRFSGELSSGIGNLSDLVGLDILLNLFSGPIPDVFHRFAKLQEFYAESNNFFGGIPNSLSNSRTIASLVLRNNYLNGVIDLNCSKMTHVVSLSLATNLFTRPVPDNLPLCPSLKIIDHSQNNFTRQILESFRNFHGLSRLSISSSAFFNLSAALDILQHCQNLTILALTLVFMLLDLSWNRLDGTIPPWLGNFEFLFYIDLSNNYFIGEIPKNLTILECLISRDVLPKDPSLGLPFPFFIERVTSISRLQYNQIWRFSPTLDLSNNFLTGPIWPEFGHLKNCIIWT